MEYKRRYYSVLTVPSPQDIEKGRTARINKYVWGGVYMPKAYFKAVFVRDDGFYIRLWAKEKDPKAVYKNYMDPVYKDSCLEFFASFGKEGYINCEVNSLGTLLSAFGASREGRVPLIEVAGMLPDVKAEVLEDEWMVDIRISLELIERVYGISGIDTGFSFDANAYKCGDECKIKHYGSYSPICTSEPDFHRPEFFARFTVVSESE